ncbi:carbohydrate ABC transporter substrate-binding protein, CUT1 family [Tistlia consotensis]|uniref:Carbohydrate ABC transporter substrate-binding protein, CUT1 family n=1 Tax=Tistlia consotensis USBA 355 TaxID=560819 RepID=A0A1Y6C519_9PROT|nr:extracellular solute-binding protein [Tistlia consotensis]SMF37403.1 carbohydrate ABC transporter substrate-binding protein, CUT1 family [Tistlia consotensis USBA 355]SNR72754.1 carbohydrate ABC transporter substrate-binding protein, CUT1 family [Tistlia consotensis]
MNRNGFTPRCRLLAGAALATGLLAGLAGPASAAWSYAEAAKPYKGTTIHVLDEITPLQETLAKLVPTFTEETGIKVEYELLNHFEVINKGQADMLSGRGYYDAIMLHGFQLGPMLDAGVLRPIDDLKANAALADPDFDEADLIEPAYKTTAFSGGKQYGFLNWNYNQIYWARGDLFGDPGEQAAFKAKYGYALAPATTFKQLRDIAEFFTRPAGATLAGKTLDSPFYGIVLEGIKGGSTFLSMWGNFIKSYGGDIVDADGHPTFDTPTNVEAIAAWAELWKFAPPGTAEYSLIDVPTVMGNGIAAQAIAWSDFVLGIDRPGASPYAGKFLYGAMPYKEGMEAKRSVEGEPSAIVISQASKNPEATFLFLQWLVEKQQQTKLLEAGQGGVPIRESSWSLPVMQDGPLAGMFKAMKSSLEVTTGKPKMPKFYELYDALTGISQEIGLGKLSPAEGAAKAQKAMLGICDPCLLK